MEIKVKAINLIDDASSYQNFSCGYEDASMSEFLRDEARKAYDDGYAVTQVLFNGDNQDVIGYYSLKCGSFQRNIDKNTIKIVPTVEIARFAIAWAYQHKEYKDGAKFSEYMMQDAMADIMSIKQQLAGVRAITLFSVDRINARKFYQKMEFKKFDEASFDIYRDTENDGCIPMYMII